MSDSQQKMKLYQCQVRRREDTGAVETVTIEAWDEDDLIKKLHRDGFLLVSAKVVSGEQRTGWTQSPFGFLKRKKDAPPGVPPSGKAGPGPARAGFSRGIQPWEQGSFSLQMAALLQAGLPLLRAIQTVKRGSRNVYFQKVLDACFQDVKDGHPLSHAIAGFPKVFPPVWVNLIAAGEMSGTLPAVLNDITVYHEAVQRVKSKVLSALLYPALLTVLAVAAVMFLMLKIIPQFEGIFRNLKVQLPLITRMVIAVSHFMQNFFPVIVVLLIAAVIGFALGKRTPRGRYIMDLVRLRLPVMGTLAIYVALTRFSRGLSTMIRAGVPILQGLDIAGSLVQNAVIEEAVARTREMVRAGKSMSSELEKCGFFPVFMTQLLAAGEETGKMENFLKIVSDHYEEKSDSMLARLSTLIEPVLLIGIGSVIGVVVIAMILPIVIASTGGV